MPAGVAPRPVGRFATGRTTPWVYRLTERASGAHVVLATSADAGQGTMWRHEVQVQFLLVLLNMLLEETVRRIKAMGGRGFPPRRGDHRIHVRQSAGGTDPHKRNYQIARLSPRRVADDLVRACPLKNRMGCSTAALSGSPWQEPSHTEERAKSEPTFPWDSSTVTSLMQCPKPS